MLRTRVVLCVQRGQMAFFCTFCRTNVKDQSCRRGGWEFKGRGGPEGTLSPPLSFLRPLYYIYVLIFFRISSNVFWIQLTTGRPDDDSSIHGPGIRYSAIFLLLFYTRRRSIGGNMFIANCIAMKFSNSYILPMESRKIINIAQWCP